MASTGTKKSSFLTKSKKSQSRNLIFKPPDQVPIVDRDYGLIKISTDKASTPYPRVSKGIDVPALTARLEEERISKTEVTPLERADSAFSSLRFSSTSHRTHVMHPEQMPTGTPHPNKGMAVDPKLLKKQISTIDWNAELSHQWASIRRLSDIQSMLSEMETDRKSVKDLLSARSSSYKRNTLPSCLRKDYSNKPEHVHKRKKVTLISPRRSATSELRDERKNLLIDDRKSAQSTVNSSGPSSHPLSFNERRQLFCKGEYTIAKNGKKLSEYFMSNPVDKLDIVDGTFCDDQRATDAIELFIRKQGFIKAPAGTLTGNTKIKLNDSASQTSFASSPSAYLLTRKSGNYSNIFH
ncbi:uncharacterized protein [Drosophila virilis]|uniref:Uncharacterized protein n=1 Tax=Drosophila virilis TaxID=7244 RepID=A0A0Q9WSW1_DROVI|nr:uncharacterized protein LOC26530358 [Drosophila virilis]KRF83675.1 uncharacterized protein Dvir_GJ25588 [Drosophila virilis]